MNAVVKALTTASTLTWGFLFTVIVPPVLAVVFVRESLVELRGEVRGFSTATQARLEALEKRQQALDDANWNRAAMKYWAGTLAAKNETLKVPEVERWDG